MGKTPFHIPDAEWAVLSRLWDAGPATVRQLADALYPSGGPSEYATVHKLLERLEAKDYVARERGGGAYVFRAARSRDAVIGEHLATVVEKMCGGSLQPLLSNLVRVKRLSPQELRELYALLDSVDPKAKRKRDRDD
jgi:predicted transcriptional regulator